MQAAILRIPQLGSALDTLAMSRLCWSLYVTFESGMELRRALALAQRSTAERALLQPDRAGLAIDPLGKELNEALEATGVFPRRFIDQFIGLVKDEEVLWHQGSIPPYEEAVPRLRARK